MGFYHGQNCGSYSIKLEPDLQFFLVTSSGTKGPRGYPYNDTLTLKKTELSDIGEYQVKMTVYQNPAIGDGYKLPKPDIMQPISYDF